MLCKERTLCFRIGALGVVLLTITHCSTNNAFAQDLHVPSQKEISAYMRHQAALVRTLECEYEVVSSPTRPEMVEALRQLSQGEDRYFKMYVVTQEKARNRNYSARWWRKGERERLDTRSLSGARTTNKAYDGNVFRSLERGGDGASGSLNTLEESHWRDSFRTEPFDLLYQCCEIPYSDVLAKGKDFSASTITIQGQPNTQVSVKHPTNPNLSFTFLFDNELRLVQRQLLELHPRDQRLYENERVNFNSYRRHEDSSGEIIWFPDKVIIHRFRGIPLPDGTPVEWVTETITFNKVQFNVDIPDDLFVIDFPADAKIWDGMTGQGWLPPSSAQSLWTNPPRPGRSWLLVWVGVAGGTAILLALLGIFLWRRRRAATS